MTVRSNTRKDKLSAIAQLREQYHSQHCRAINYILAVNKGGGASKKKRESAFSIATWTAYFAFSDEYPEIHPDARLHKTGRDFHVELDKVDASISAAQVKLEPMLSWLEEKIESADGGHEAFGASYTHYTGLRNHLRRWREQLDNWEECVPKDFVIPYEDIEKLARHIRTLVLVQDGPRVRAELERIAHEGGAEAQTIRSLQEAGWNHIPNALSHASHSALNSIRAYLRKSQDFLSIGGQPPHIFLLQPNGLREEPFFKAYFRAILDVLVADDHPVKLGVCEVCESIYVRNRMGHEHDTESRVCDGNCRRALR